MKMPGNLENGWQFLFTSLFWLQNIVFTFDMKEVIMPTLVDCLSCIQSNAVIVIWSYHNLNLVTVTTYCLWNIQLLCLTLSRLRSTIVFLSPDKVPPNLPPGMPFVNHHLIMGGHGLLPVNAYVSLMLIYSFNPLKRALFFFPTSNFHTIWYWKSEYSASLLTCLVDLYFK